MYSLEHKIYLKKLKKEKRLILFFKIIILILLIFIWELLARLDIINTFLFSSPSKIINTIVNLYNNYNLFSHIWTTTYETIISFTLATILGIIIATILWWNNIIAKILDPYLTIINSLPKVSLGPLIIIWVGAKTNSIILMALLISLFTTIINMYNAFRNIPKSMIILLKSFEATKMQIFTKLVFPSNINNLINTLKINISLTLIGVIMGELLVSKQGLGYLINYGSQIFNLNLVITSIFILGILSYVIYSIVTIIQKKLVRNN